MPFVTILGDHAEPHVVLGRQRKERSPLPPAVRSHPANLHHCDGPQPRSRRHRTRHTQPLHAPSLRPGGLDRVDRPRRHPSPSHNTVAMRRRMSRFGTFGVRIGDNLPPRRTRSSKPAAVAYSGRNRAGIGPESGRNRASAGFFGETQHHFADDVALDLRRAGVDGAGAGDQEGADPRRGVVGCAFVVGLERVGRPAPRRH